MVDHCSFFRFVSLETLATFYMDMYLYNILFPETTTLTLKKENVSRQKKMELDKPSHPGGVRQHYFIDHLKVPAEYRRKKRPKAASDDIQSSV